MTILEEGRPLYELVHESDDMYFTLGIFDSLGEAIAAVDQHGVQLVDDAEDSACVEVRRRKVGLCDAGKILWKRTWIRDWEAEGVDERWEVKDQQFLI